MTETPTPDDASAWALLRQAPFRQLWLARIAGTAGSQMMMVALAWQIYDLTGSAWDLGLVGLLQFLPSLLLALPAGHVVDRHDRRRVVMAAVATLASVAAVLLVASATGVMSRWLVFALSVVLGATRAFQMPAQQALLPAVVRTDDLAPATALASGALQAAIVAGPALGGALYAAGGSAHAAGGAVAVYGTSVVLFLVGLGCLSRLGRLALRPVARLEASASLATLFAGVGFIWQRKAMLGAISLDLFAVLLGGATALLPIFARDLLQAGPVELGALRAAPAAGAFTMSIWLAHHPLQRRVGAWMLGAVGVFGLAMIGFGLSRTFWGSLAALAVSGAADMVSVVVRQTLVQLETPDEMRGRVSAVNSVFIGASNQLGEFESGATAALWGPVASVVAGGIGTLGVVALWWRLFPSLAQRDRLQP